MATTHDRWVRDYSQEAHTPPPHRPPQPVGRAFGKIIWDGTRAVHPPTTWPYDDAGNVHPNYILLCDRCQRYGWAVNPWMGRVA